MRGALATCLLLAASGAAHAVAAQTPGRALSLTLTHSLGSSTSAHPPPCPTSCVSGDVLAPLSVSTVEVELSLPLRARGRMGLEYHARLVPLAIVRNNPIEAAMLGPFGWSISQSTDRDTTLGFGIKPAGLRGWVGGDHVRLEADASAGILRFGTPLLAANAAYTNFVYELGVGLRLGPRGAAIGYRRHHVSNAGLADVNPGLNSHVLFIGLPIF